MNINANIIAVLVLFTPLFCVASGTPAKNSTAIFAGGCFWCMEPPFDKLNGVIETVSGYTGGKTDNPTYLEVSSGRTGHYEAVKVVYDPDKVNYNQLLTVFWHNIDPTDDGGQFCDRGSSYRAAIFYGDAEQKSLAEKSKNDVTASKQVSRVVTPIIKASMFYPAEDYHQNYYQKNPLKYKLYRYRCGRDQRLQQVWGNH